MNFLEKYTLLLEEIVGAETLSSQKNFLLDQNLCTSGDYENFRIKDLISYFSNYYQYSEKLSEEILFSSLQYQDWVSASYFQGYDEAILELAEDPFTVFRRIFSVGIGGDYGFDEVLVSMALCTEKGIAREVLRVPVAYLCKEGRGHLRASKRNWEVFPIKSEGWSLNTLYVPNSAANLRNFRF
ncbi:hypothetical protein MHT86_04370 [Corynebacterium mastitidis]|uniref:hypothetical protein n=1 Tax=Corynebacterium mastitidis TaxID=161890 RepID=UPI0012FF070B|nr:hypothetical protein [Corynebacterium mastitidis]MCH6196735.1 hypothetical protein [Corynebacterium mastitidis]